MSKKTNVGFAPGMPEGPKAPSPHSGPTLSKRRDRTTASGSALRSQSFQEWKQLLVMGNRAMGRKEGPQGQVRDSPAPSSQPTGLCFCGLGSCYLHKLNCRPSQAITSPSCHPPSQFPQLLIKSACISPLPSVLLGTVKREAALPTHLKLPSLPASHSFPGS